MSENSAGIKSWPRDERPREKLADRGPSALTSGELLAILLRTGNGPGLTALDMGRKIWSVYHESWQELSSATVGELAKLPGVGQAKAATIVASMEMGRRLSLNNLNPSAPFCASRQVFEHYAGRFAGLKKELFYCLMLDVKNRYIREERISEGSLTSSLVHPREAFRAAVRESAAGVIFAHNHPSGDPTPSREDMDLTRRLWEAGNILGIRVLDHIVVGANNYFSFADEGRLAFVSKN